MYPQIIPRQAPDLAILFLDHKELFAQNIETPIMALRPIPALSSEFKFDKEVKIIENDIVHLNRVLNLRRYPMETSGSETSMPPGDDIRPESFFGSVKRVIGHEVTVRQGVVQLLEADRAVVRQGVALQLNTKEAVLTSSTLGLAQSEHIELNSSQAAGLLAKQNVNLDQSGVQFMVSAGPATLKQSGVVVMVAREVAVEENSGVVFLIANHVSGNNLTTLFGAREAAVFGAVAGLVSGIFFFLTRLIKRRK